jgi:hypothetical protein
LVTFFDKNQTEPKWSPLAICNFMTIFEQIQLKTLSMQTLGLIIWYQQIFTCFCILIWTIVLF